jgi:hypothetical protein
MKPILIKVAASGCWFNRRFGLTSLRGLRWRRLKALLSQEWEFKRYSCWWWWIIPIFFNGWGFWWRNSRSWGWGWSWRLSASQERLVFLLGAVISFSRLSEVWGKGE